MGARVLLAEDDAKQAEIVRRYLIREGHQPVLVDNGRDAIEQARTRNLDLLILDIMLPRVDGLDVCRALRHELETPILMLTALSGEDDLLLALDIGADDYITKPYSPRELMARVRALLRRTRRLNAESTDSDHLQVGRLAIDLKRHTIHVGDRQVFCTPGEFAVLVALASHPEAVLSRTQLLMAVHGSDEWITRRTIDVHVMNLRRKIENDARAPDRLITVFGVGYKLTVPPSEANEP